MEFPKTIPIPDFGLRIKEWALLGYEVYELGEPGYHAVLTSNGDVEGVYESMTIIAVYRLKRRKRYYLIDRWVGTGMSRSFFMDEFRHRSVKELDRPW